MSQLQSREETQEHLALAMHMIGKPYGPYHSSRWPGSVFSGAHSVSFFLFSVIQQFPTKNDIVQKFLIIFKQKRT